MEDYLEKLKLMVRDLEHHPDIKVIEFKINPPAQRIDLDRIEDLIGVALDQSIRGFYEQANGLKIHWAIKPDISIEKAEEIRKKSSDYYVKIAEYLGNPFSIINLIPVEEVFIRRKWKEISAGLKQKNVDICGTKSSIKELHKKLKPFDIINREYCMAFMLEEGNRNPKILFLSEGYTDWNSSRITDFASYLNMLLATRGIVEAREKIFLDIQGYLKPSLIGDLSYWNTNYTPMLFQNEQQLL